MYKSVQEAIANSTAASKSYWQTLFGGDGTAEYDPAYQQILALTNQAYDDAMEQAEEISRGMRDALTSAFADGQISEEEYQQILSYMQSYNDAIARAAAEAQSEEAFIQQQKWLYQSQTASAKEIEEISAKAQQAMEDELAAAEDRYLTERFRAQYRWEQAIENGRYIDGELATSERMEEALGRADERHQAEIDTIRAGYAQFFMDLFGSQRAIQDLSPEADGKMLAMQMAAMGGQEGIESARRGYEEAGDTEAAAQIAQVQSEIAAAGITSTSAVWWNPLTWFKGYETDADQMTMANAWAAAQAGASGSTYTPIGQQEAQIAWWQRYFNIKREITSTNPYLQMDWRTAGQAVSNLFSSPQADVSAISDGIEEISGQGLTVDVGGDLTALDNEIAARNGTSITVGVVPSLAGGKNGGTSSTTGISNQFFASGGRATEPSIFGEGDTPEWAIPEEHSERTAALLNAARAASGFTWPDLLARFGGLNASPNNSPSTFIYSPVIHANNASGVAEALKEDKQRLEKWWKEQKMRDAMEVYT